MSKGYGHYRNWIYAKYDLLGNVIHETYARLDEVTNDNNLAYVGDWQQNGSYFKNDLVSYEDKTYKVIEDVSGSLVPPSEDEEHYVEFNSDIVSFITLTSASGTLNANQMRYILASKNTSLVYNDRVYQQVGTTNGSTNFVSFGTIDNENYIYVITVASNGSYTRTSNRIVKEEEVATDLGINEPNNLVYLVRGETKLGNGAAFKTINGVSIIGSGNIIVGESGTIAIDDELSTTSENAVQNKVITAELNTKAVLGAFNGGGTGVDYADLANNLIASKGLEVESYFTFEKTGGEQASAIETGNGTLKNLYGKTEKSENQIVLLNRTLSNNGVTAVIKDGVITLNGTATAVGAFYDIYRGISYDCGYGCYHYGSLTNGSVNIIANVSGTAYNSYSNRSHTTNDFIREVNTNMVNGSYGLSIVFSSGTTFTNYQLRSMVWKNGSTAPTTWSQGYEGLKHTHITGLKSTQINLFDEIYEGGGIDDNGELILSGSAFRTKNYQQVVGGDSYCLHSELDITSYSIVEYDSNFNFVKKSSITINNSIFTLSPLTKYVKGTFWKSQSGWATNVPTKEEAGITFNFSNANINGNYYPYEQDTLDIEFEGNGVGTASDELNVEEGKKYVRMFRYNLGDLNYQKASASGREGWFQSDGLVNIIKFASSSTAIPNLICDIYTIDTATNVYQRVTDRTIGVSINGYIQIYDSRFTETADIKQFLQGVYIVSELATPIVTDVEIPKDTIKVWNGGSMEALGTEVPVGTKIFYQKNIKSFVEAFGEAINWNPDRIERLAKLSITPEYVNISLNPTQANAYAVAQVYNATFTIVISTALTGTADSSITFQDSEIDLSSFETQPAESIYDMDGKKVSEEPTTEDCNIASFVGRSYNGIVLWSLLHSGVNKVKVHFEQAIPLDSEGNGKLDCRASLIL